MGNYSISAQLEQPQVIQSFPIFFSAPSAPTERGPPRIQPLEGGTHSIASHLYGNNLYPAFPFCHQQLSCAKPGNYAYPKELNTLGDHLKKRRLELGLSQVEVAERLQVNEATIVNWEKGHREPAARHVPRIVQVLGYPPFPEGDIPSEELKEEDEPDKPRDLNG